jgi:hypothetical protein
MHPFLEVSRAVLMVSMMIAILQPPATAQGKERPVKHPTSYRTIQVGDSGEAERIFRGESERHSGMNPNTIGA